MSDVPDKRHPRLHVLMAREAPTAVVLRRGPSRRVCSILWDRRADTFTLGQWYAGRIYEHKSDISPDGSLWIYFALNGRWRSEAKGSYTVLARTPWLKALGLWPVGDTWGGGGLFSKSGRYWPFQDDSLVEHPDLPRPSRDVVGARWYDGVIYSSRLVRDGWRLVDAPDDDAYYPRAYHKPAHSGWTLRRVWDLRRENFELLHGPTERRLELPGWEWADIDGERLVWAQAGGLWEGRLEHTGLVHVRELHNFADMRFRRIRAPY